MSLLKNILPQKEDSEYVLLLNIEEDFVYSFIIQIDGNNLVQRGKGKCEIKDQISQLEAIDKTVSEAEQNMQNEVEKTVFLLPPDYLENNKIKSSKEKHLKKISKDLNLKPIGYIDYPKAISLLYEKDEGAPPNVLLLVMSRTNIFAFTIRVGKIKESVSIKRSSNLSKDMSAIISELNTDILPSKIIIKTTYYQKSSVLEEFSKISWQKFSPFLHTPKIDLIKTQKMISAASEAIHSTLINKFEEKEAGLFPDEKYNTNSSDNDDDLSDSKTEEFPTKKVESTTLSHEQQAENFQVNNTFGFIKESTEKTNLKNTESKKSSQQDHEILTQEAKKRKIMLPKINLNFLRILPLKQSIIPIFLFFIISGLAIYYIIFAYPKAQVSLIVNPLTSTENTNITLTTNQDEIENEKNIVLAKPVELELEAEKNASATGQTTVGERAKGQITIYNKTLTPKTFSKNSIIQNGSLEFSLDNEVKIASASDTGEGLTYGKQDVNITASTIGEESNLAAGSTFILKDFPETSYSARNAQAFSGGTSRKVTSVSEKDLNILEDSLVKELSQKAKSEIENQLNPEENILEPSVETKIIDKTASHKIGEEANNFNLKIKLSYSALSYNQNSLSSFAKEFLRSPPSGYSRENSRTSVKILDVELDKDNNYIVNASITTYFLPEIQQARLQESIKGKKYSDITDIVSEISRVNGVKISQIRSNILFKNRLPFNKNNIYINTVIQ